MVSPDTIIATVRKKSEKAGDGYAEGEKKYSVTDSVCLEYAGDPTYKDAADGVIEDQHCCQ